LKNYMKKIPTDPDFTDLETEEYSGSNPEQNAEFTKKDSTEGYHFYGALRSDVGLARERNEDSCFLFTSDSAAPSSLFPMALCLVADGMGGYEGGDRASKIASRTAASYLLERLYLPALNGEQPPSQDQIEQMMAEAVLTAHEAVLSPDYLGNGGTTLTMTLLLGRQLYLAHVGDSRAYWLVEGGLQQLTKDHSLVQRLQDEGKLTPEEAENFQFRNILIRALGQDEELLIDVDVRDLPSQGKLLLCSDGLCGEVSDAQILAIMNQPMPPDQIADQLIAAALEAGGWDNISAIVTEFMI
jgi:serine/threonine protein phosphatase PrpC